MRSLLRPSDATYRRDIDGLRALAVVSVVVYHIASSLLPGGFAGVDIFFVISGYLITRIILAEIAEGRFSYAAFYARRIRRIFPALVVVILATLAIGWWVLLPDEYASLGRHAVAGALFGSNILHWLESGYFDIDAARKPLLNLWSLGVEEQFYIFWPILLAAIWRLGRGRMRAVALVAVGSFALNIALVRLDPSAAFYLPVTRFWELLAGALLAMAERRHPARAGGLLDGRAADVASVAGTLLCLGSFVLLSKSLAYPGWFALAPVAGAALLIASGAGGIVNRTVLACRPAVYIGLISYPLYLWHWPLLSFVEIVQITDDATRIAAELGMGALSVGLAALTYHTVELPLARARRVGVLRGLAVAMSAVVILGAGVTATRGFDEARGPWNLAEAPRMPAGAELRTPACAARHGAAFGPASDRARDFCVEGREALSGVVVLGDSHANRFFAGLHRIDGGRSSMLGQASCIPVPGLEQSQAGRAIDCSTALDGILSAVGAASPRVVILHGYFLRAFRASREADPAHAWREGLRQALASLSPAAQHVVLLLGMPELPFDPSRCIRRPIRSAPAECSVARADYEAQKALTAPLFAEIAAEFPNVTVFDPAEALCRGSVCDVIRDGRLLFYDDNHLTAAGAELVATALLSRLREEDLAAR